MELEFEIAAVYLKSKVTVEFFLLEIHFGLETKSLVIKERRERGNRTAVDRVGFRAVDFSSQCQRYNVFRIYLRRLQINRRYKKKKHFEKSSTLVH